MHRTLIALLILGVTVSASSAAYADDPPTMVELTGKQVEYFNKASKALAEGEPDKAIEYYRLALKSGEANVLYAALGRALYRKGRCKEADVEYQNALTAPTVAQPSPAEVREKIEEYRIGLRVECPGQLAIQCTPEDMTVRLSGGARRSCKDFPIELKPDFYRLEGSAGGKIVETEVKVVGMETSEVTLTIDVNQPAPAVATTTRTANHGASTNWVNLGIVGAGGALLVTAAVFDVAVLGPAIDDLESAASARSADEQQKLDDAEGAQTTALILYAGGAVVLTTGLILWMLEPTSDDEGQATNWHPWFGQDSAGFSWEGRW